jgi:hypothetical protein
MDLEGQDIVARLEKSYRSLVTMSQLAPLLLRSLLTSMVSMLFVVGAVHAHGGRGADCGQHGHHQATGSVAETPSIPQASVAEAAAGPAAVAPGLQRMSITESGPCEQSECNHGFGGGCCAMACHAVVADLCPIVFAAFQPTSVDPTASAPFLHGRLVGPGDRPPRSA